MLLHIVESFPQKTPAYFVALLLAFRQDIMNVRQELVKSIPSPIEEPIRFFLVNAYMSRIDKVLALMSENGVMTEPLTEELWELHSWIMPQNKELKLQNTAQFGGWDGVGDVLVARGHSYSGAKRLIKRLQGQTKGAPPKTRLNTVAALDYRIFHKRTLSQVTKKFCQCGASTHGTHCQDKVRHQIGELEKVLAKYGFKLL